MPQSSSFQVATKESAFTLHFFHRHIVADEHDGHVRSTNCASLRPDMLFVVAVQNKDLGQGEFTHPNLECYDKSNTVLAP